MDFITDIINDPLCGGLIRTTLFLSIGFCLVEGFLSLFKISSAKTHQFCWFAVLLLGWVWIRPTLDLSFSEHAALSSEPTSTEVPSASVSTLFSAYSKQITLTVLFVWTVGICVVLLRALRKYRQLIHLLSETVEPTNPWKEQWEKIAKYEDLPKPVPMRVSNQLGPMLLRRLHGYEIVVPMELWKTLQPRERLCLLRLQLSRLRSRDLWKFFLVRLLVLPHWFNPLSWIALRRFDRSVDFACDEKVFQETSESPDKLQNALIQWKEHIDQLANRYTKEQQFSLGRDFEKESNDLSLRISRLETFRHESLFIDSALKKSGLAGLLTLMFLALIVQIEPSEKETSSVAHRNRTNREKPYHHSAESVSASKSKAIAEPLAVEYNTQNEHTRSEIDLYTPEETARETSLAVDEQPTAESGFDPVLPEQSQFAQTGVNDIADDPGWGTELGSQPAVNPVADATSPESEPLLTDWGIPNISQPLPELAENRGLPVNPDAPVEPGPQFPPEANLAQNIPNGTVARPGFKPSVPYAPTAPYPPPREDEGTIEQVRGSISIQPEFSASNSLFTQPIHELQTPQQPQGGIPSPVPPISALAGAIETDSTAFDPVDDSDDSPYESEEPFVKRFPNARTPFASQLIKPDFRPLVILDDHGNEVKNPAITLLHEKLSSFLQEGDVVDTMDMIRAIPDRRTRFTLLIEFCDQLAYQVKNSYSEHQINEEELFRKVDQIANILHTASQTAKEIKPDSVRDDAYAALAERSGHYVGDFTSAKNILVRIKSPLLRSNKLMELAELQKTNDSATSANETLRLSRESLKIAIQKGEIQQTDSLIKNETAISTSENKPLNR